MLKLSKALRARVEKNEKGFTLIELLVVVIIIGIVSLLKYLAVF